MAKQVKVEDDQILEGRFSVLAIFENKIKSTFLLDTK
jgi:hypothetical protein